MAKTLMIVCFVALGLFAVGEALKCQVCSQTSGSGIAIGSDGCGENWDKSKDYSLECTSTDKYCEKQTGKVTGAKSVTRSCTSTCTAAGVTDQTISGISYTVACCETDNCNGAASLLPALSLLVGSLVIKALW